MKKIAFFVAIFVAGSAGQAFAGPNWLTGEINNYTAIQGGIMIMLDTGIPDNCAGTGYGWMIVAETDKALTAVLLMRINQGNMGATVYSDGTFYQGFCRIVQLDPYD